MTTLVQCTKTKRDTATIARKLYDPSPLFRKMRAFAVARGEPWYILSAEHGLVGPERTLQPYDAFGLSEQQAQTVVEALTRRGETEVTLVAGKTYREPLLTAAEDSPVSITTVGAGLRIGELQAELTEQTKRLENEGLDTYAQG